jgi:hypothetical protein
VDYPLGHGLSALLCPKQRRLREAPLKPDTARPLPRTCPHSRSLPRTPLVGLRAWYDPAMTQRDLADGPLEQARDALRRHAWQQCYEIFSAADETESLSAEDLADMAEAAWASGHYIECIQVRERAYAAFAERKETRRAAQQALDLFSGHLIKGDTAVAGGWYSTARRLLADQPECPEHGGLAPDRGVLRDVDG